MTSIQAAGTLLAADAGARTLTYRLLPFGEPGRTSVGVVTASRGSITLPAPRDVVLNVEHDRTRPVGWATSLVEHDDALVATFAIAETRAGDDLLAESIPGPDGAPPLRPGVSVELDDIVIRSGALTAGRLVAAGAVVTPAFPSALLVAADAGDDPDPTPDPAPVDPDEDDTDPDAAPAPVENGDPMSDTAPVTATAPAAAPAALVATATVPAPAMTLSRASRLLAAVGSGDRDPALLAALSDLTHTAMSEVQAPQFIDEVWSGSQYERQVVPLLGHDTLTSYKVTGWRWKVAPAGVTYAGDKGAVASNAAETEPVEFPAVRWAGAHDVDRKFRDFGDESFWRSYWQAMGASYAAWSDAQASTGLLAAAPAVTPDGTGVVAAIVKACLAVIPNGTPTFCLMGSAAFAELVERDPLAFLSGTVSLTGGDGTVGGLQFRASSALAASQVLVGTRNAATFYELGETPIRVEAINVANGGIDVGAFGYATLGVHKAAGLAKATVTAPAP